MTRKLFADSEVINDKNDKNDKSEYYENEIELYKEQINNLLLINENLIRQPNNYDQVNSTFNNKKKHTHIHKILELFVVYFFHQIKFFFFFYFADNQNNTQNSTFWFLFWFFKLIFTFKAY